LCVNEYKQMSITSASTWQSLPQALLAPGVVGP